MIERLNQTVKQRTKVAKIFANEESCLRLVSAIVMEVSEQWVGGRMYLRVKYSKWRWNRCQFTERSLLNHYGFFNSI